MAQAVDGIELNSETPAVVDFTLREVVQNLQDLRVGQGISDALWLEGLWERRMKRWKRNE